MAATTPQMNRTDVSAPVDQAFKSLFGQSGDSIASSAIHSTTFLQKFLAIAVSNVAYLRALMPDASFRDRYMGDLHLKVISTGSGSHPIARKLVHHVKGCFDAVEKKYLRTLTLWFFEERENPEKVLEAYVFSFDYTEDDVNVTLSRNQKVFSETRSGRDIKRAVVEFLKTLLLTVEELDALPSEIFLKMQLTYFDSRTPADYQPPGFYHSATKLAFSTKMTKTLNIGRVASNHHALALRIKTAASICDQSEDLRSVSAVDVERTYGLDHDTMTEGENEEKRQRLTERQDRTLPSVVAPGSAMTPGEAVEEATGSPAVPDETQLDVRCICGGTQDGKMIACGRCEKWQHAICYGVFYELGEQLQRHVCVSCAGSDENDKACLDPSLRAMTKDALKKRALFRRALVATAAPEIEQLTNSRLRCRLAIDEQSAQSLIDKMISLELIDQNEQNEDETTYLVRRQALETFLKKAGEKMKRVMAASSVKENKKSRAAKRKAQGESDV